MITIPSTDNKRIGPLTVLLLLTSCAVSPSPTNSFIAAENHCDDKYPTRVGNMSAQANCVSNALNMYGESAFGDYYIFAQQINEKRVDLWRQADARSISIVQAQNDFIGYRDRILQEHYFVKIENNEPDGSGVLHRYPQFGLTRRH